MNALAQNYEDEIEEVLAYYGGDVRAAIKGLLKDRDFLVNETKHRPRHIFRLRTRLGVEPLKISGRKSRGYDWPDGDHTIAEPCTLDTFYPPRECYGSFKAINLSWQREGIDSGLTNAARSQN